MVKAETKRTYLVVDKETANRMYKYKIIGRTWNDVVAMILDGYERMDMMLGWLRLNREAGDEQDLKGVVDDVLNEYKEMKERHLGYTK